MRWLKIGLAGAAGGAALFFTGAFPNLALPHPTYIDRLAAKTFEYLHREPYECLHECL